VLKLYSLSREAETIHDNFTATWEDNIKTDIRSIRCQVVDWSGLNWLGTRITGILL
jgi:hypothetical protein